MSSAPPAKKDILKLDHLIGKRLHVKFQGGREVEGVLNCFDPLVNLVLDDAHELLPATVLPQRTKRKLGDGVVCRGTLIMLICPEDGFEEIANPFLNQEEEESA